MSERRIPYAVIWLIIALVFAAEEVGIWRYNTTKYEKALAAFQVRQIDRLRPNVRADVVGAPCVMHGWGKCEVIFVTYIVDDNGNKQPLLGMTEMYRKRESK